MRAHRVVIGLLAGLVLGSILASFGAPAQHVADWLEPIGQLWVNAIRMTIVPLVISLLFVGIAERDASEGLGRIGAVTIATFIAILVFAAVFALLLAPPLISDMRMPPEAAAALRSTATAGKASMAERIVGLPGFSAWLVNLVPANPIRAAADGAMLPLIVFTLLLALATRAIDAPLRASLVQFFGAIAAVTTRIVDWIIAVAPIGVFALVAVAASRMGVALAGAMAYYVIGISALLVLFALVLYPVASIGGRIPLGWFTRAAVPAQAVALSSSSSLASLPALVEGGRALGLPTAITGFVLPLSVSTFKAATPITWMMGTVFLARLYGVSLATPVLVTLAFTAVALSFTIPGVPQGAQLMLAPLLVGYGIPAEGVALIIAVDTIPDLFGTMTNVTADLVVAAVVAQKGSAGIAESWSDPATSPDA